MMNRPRVALGLESASVTLNFPVATRIGQQLATAREASAVSVSTVADRLLLSRSQVLALEAVDPSPFYNAKFQAAALRKYADLLGVEAESIDHVLVEPSSEDANVSRSAHPGVLRGWLDGVPRPGVPVAIAAVALVTVGALVLLAG